MCVFPLASLLCFLPTKAGCVSGPASAESPGEPRKQVSAKQASRLSGYSRAQTSHGLPGFLRPFMPRLGPPQVAKKRGILVPGGPRL